MADSVLTLADLERWSFTGTALAVLGQPIRHSISPTMHNAALQDLARADPRFLAWRYFRFEVAPADLPVALRRLHACGFHGLNLTVPHKVLAMSAVESVEPGGQRTGAVNTLLRTSSGWHGHNTDGHGLTAGLREELGLAVGHRPVILLGAGGAARAAAVECIQQGCTALWIGNRTAARRDTLIQELSPAAAGRPVQGFAPAEPPADLPRGAIVINATSAGLRADDDPPVDLRRLPRPAAVFDMIYSPARTPLLQTAELLGVPCANGLSMLVHQGARSLAIWTGTAAPVAVMRQAAQAALGS